MRSIHAQLNILCVDNLLINFGSRLSEEPQINKIGGLNYRIYYETEDIAATRINYTIDV